MDFIYSNITKELLHIIIRKEDIVDVRKDVVPEDNFLQMACFKLAKGKTFKPHKHILQTNKIPFRIAQESWVVISGKVMATLYDVHDNVIKEVILNEGDCSITLYGAHNYECLEDGSKILEFKTGPYEGQQKDKMFI